MTDTLIVMALQKEITKHLEMIRSIDDPHESLLSGRQPYFSHMALEPAPLSPRQTAQDERRPSLLGAPPRQSLFRPPVPSHLNISPRRYGSIGTVNPSPNFQRPVITQAPPSASSQHPLASVYEPSANLARRHTSADIRVPGWPPQAGSPFDSGQSSAHWPSSPNRTPNPGDQQVRDVLAQYEIGGSRQSYDNRHHTPPLTNDHHPTALGGENAWSFNGPKFPRLDSAPQTRRSSMASNVHSLLNPAETAERDEDLISDDRNKRKRLQ